MSEDIAISREQVQILVSLVSARNNYKLIGVLVFCTMSAPFIVYSTKDGCVLAEGVPVDCIGTTEPAPHRGPNAHLMRGTVHPLVSKGFYDKPIYEENLVAFYRKNKSMILYGSRDYAICKYGRNTYKYLYDSKYALYDIDPVYNGYLYYSDFKPCVRAPKPNCVHAGESCVAFPVGSSIYYFRVVEDALELAAIIEQEREFRYRDGHLVSTHIGARTTLYSGGQPNCELLKGEIVGLYHAGKELYLPKEPADVKRTVKIREPMMRFRYVYDPSTHLWTCSEKIISTTS